MAAVILHPQHLLRRRFHHETLAPHPRSAPNPISHCIHHTSSVTTARRRNRSPLESRSAGVGGSGGGGGGSRSRCTAENSKLVMGQVKILKRGETLSEFQNKERNRDSESTSKTTRRSVMRNNGGGCSEDLDLVLGSTCRIGPDPDTVTKQIRDWKSFEIVAVGFAGACCSVSPPPSSVPIPDFLGKKNNLVA
ncbi:PREDICTED: uncharacterized protein LOC104808926 [Tarenaya hassleriana]|uniref:uncharacterized protein LOC104808926 n=1 Tax=Tarenaya hassleriana TaxID=28532 RepID=UPI00053C966F|nr:PREDICTED: uncharacterized protein LOC104808926 [Tarenaya hassleriana]